MQKLNDDIYLLDANYLKKNLAAIYLLVYRGKCAIIETGTSYSLPNIFSALEQLNLNYDDVSYIIPTHVHLDHAGGAGALMQSCKQAKLVAHPFGSRHLIDPTRLIAGTKAVYGAEKFTKVYGEIIAVDEKRIIESSDNLSLNLNGRALLLIDTPGHANHHFCVYDKLSQGVFTGDTFGLAYDKLMVNGKPFVFATTTPVQFNPEKLLNSIDKVCQFNIKKLYLTHFGAIDYSDNVVTQLKNSVKAFRDIALSTQNKKLNADTRSNEIAEKMRLFLLKELKKHGCQLSIDAQKKAIEYDVLLNTKGVSVWLDKINAA